MNPDTSPVITESIVLSGRTFSPEEITQIAKTARCLHRLSRKELAQTLCEHLGWQRLNGANRLEACLAALEKLERLGLVSLPPLRPKRAWQPRPHVEPTLCAPEQPLTGPLDRWGRPAVRPVDGAEEETLWNQLVDHYHYLGYRGAFGARLRYFIHLPQAGETPVGCLLFAASAWHVECREQWLGWDGRTRMARLHLILNNSRFLLLPWVRVPNLASAALAAAARRLPGDWQLRFAYQPVLLEAFVDPARFHGGCYRAAGWQWLGQSTGTSRSRQRGQALAPKHVFVRPLTAQFRHHLCAGELHD
jgi:hypothetical protein